MGPCHWPRPSPSTAPSPISGFCHSLSLSSLFGSRISIPHSWGSLIGTGIGAAGAVALAGALRVNTALLELELGANNFLDEGVAALAESLKVNCTLNMLSISCRTTTKSIRVLADALKTNTSLTLLGLIRCDIEAAAAVLLADALKINTTLTTIVLSQNEFGDEGTVALADMLAGNTSLTFLDLCLCGLGSTGARALVDALKLNVTLFSLSVTDIDIPDDLGAELQELMSNPAREAAMAGEADTKPALGIPLARDSDQSDDDD
eukprot:m.136480 g.136480  ORF g.136480 m.136480 type:complete len:263 (-) comp14889_c0_seq9:51-839(-)